MGTYTATITLDPTDIGISPSFIYFDNVGQGSAGNLTPGTLTFVMNGLVSSLPNLTYAITNGTDWGDPAIVTFTAVATTPFPMFILFQTGSFNYNAIFTESTAPTLCNSCQFIQLNQCGTDEFRLDLGLTDGPYTVFYEDNTTGVVWEQGTTSSTALGGLLMYQWDATVGMFNPYSFYTMTIEDVNGDAITWTQGDTEYTCATLTFKTTVNVTD